MSVLLNKPHWETLGSTHKAATGEIGVGDQEMDQIFGPHTNLLMDAASGMEVQVDQSTLQSAFRDSKDYLNTIMHTNFEQLDGWWFAFAPRMEAKAMSSYWSTIKVDKVMLEAAPEGTAPKLVGHQRRSDRAVLSRFSLGAREFHDYLLTAEGRNVWQLKLAAIVSGAAISAKVCIHNAINAQTFYYKEEQRKTGRPAGSIKDALDDEVNMWGALSLDELGFNKLNGYITKLTSEVDVSYNMVVLPHGTLDYLVHGNQYQTEASRRGEAGVQRALSLGARAMVGVLPGVTIYEDKVWKLQNFSLEQLDLLKKLSIQGYFFVLDGTDGGRDAIGTYDPVRAMSVKHRNMIPDEYTTFGPREALDASHRWDSTGKLHYAHKTLLENLSASISKSGVKPPQNGLIDPYMWRSPGAKSGGVGNSGYHIIDLWGDQNPAYRPIEIDELHGIHFRERALKTHFTAEDDAASKRLDVLMNTLTDVGSISESIEAFVFATTADPANREGDDFKAIPRRNYLKRNHVGGVKVPGVDRDPTQTNWNYDTAQVFTPSDQAANYKGKGVIFVDGKHGERLYVWKLAIDESTTWNFGNNVPQFFASNGDPNTPGAFIAGTEGTVSGGGSFVSVFTEKADGVSEKGTHAYVLAPFNHFGPVAKDGKANQWNTRLTVDSKYHSKEWKLINSAADDATLGALVVHGTKAMGFLPPQLVEAPQRPYGFGSMSNMEALSQGYIDGDTRGWGDEIFKVAFDGMEAKKKLWSVDKRVHPDNVLHDPTRVPEHMRSDDDDLDAMYATFSGQYETQVRYPVWFRTPVFADLAGKELATSYLGTKENVVGATERVLNADLAGDILGDMGITDNAGIARVSGTDSVVQFVLVRNKLLDILSNPNLTSHILTTMKDPNERAGLFDAFRGEGDYKSDLGSSYSRYKQKDRPIDVDKKNFSWFFFLEIFDEDDVDKAAALFSGVLGMATVAKRGLKQTARISGETISQMKMGARATEKKRDDLRRAPRAAAPGGATGFAYVNTNLTLANTHWKTAHSRFSKADPANYADFLSYLRSPIRPTNPARPNEPLAPEIYDELFEDADADSVKEQIAQFQFARGGLDGRGLTRSKFDIPTHPLNDKEDATMMEGFSPLDAQPQTAHPDVLYAGSMSPFYVYGDEAGTKTVYKHYMEKRYRAVIDANMDPVARFGALGLLFSKVTKASVIRCLDEKVVPPILSYECAQPFVRVYTKAALWAEGGQQTARLLYKWSDLAFQFQAVTKKWMAHYTAWFDCLVSNPTKMAYITDAQCAGYVGGMDDQIYPNPPLEPKRLSFKGSMFVFDCGASFSRDYAKKTANPQSLYGKFNPSMFSYRFDDATQSSLTNPHPPYPSFYYYNELWGFGNLASNSAYTGETYKRQRSGRSYYPGVLFMAKHLSFDPITGDYTKVHSGSGPLKNFDPPLKPALDGKVKFRGTAFTQ